MDSGKVVLGVLAGLAAGVVVGILIAPDKGSKTRQDLLDKGEGYLGDLKGKFGEFVETIAQKYNITKKDAEELIAKGKSRFDDAKKEAQNQLSEV
jgi:gas vesicle protein